MHRQFESSANMRLEVARCDNERTEYKILRKAVSHEQDAEARSRSHRIRLLVSAGLKSSRCVRRNDFHNQRSVHWSYIF